MACGRGRAEERVLHELERDLAAVRRGDAETQALERQRDVVAVHVGEAVGGREGVLLQHAAGHDAELLPGLDARLGRERLDQRRGLGVVAVHLVDELVAEALGQRVLGLHVEAGRLGEDLELAPVLDLERAAGRGRGEGLEDLTGVVHVGRRAHGVLQQEVAHDHAVGVDAADAARGLLGDAAGALGTEGAAHALLAERAAPALRLHAVPDRLFARGAGGFDHGAD